MTTNEITRTIMGDAHLDWDGAPSEIQSTGPAFHARTRVVEQAMRRLRPRALLDIGCGRGNVTALAAPFAETVLAVDLAEQAVQETRARLATHPRAQAVVANVITGDWGGAALPPAGFDAILLSEVLEHLDDDTAILARARELLAPDGHLVATVPAKPELWTRWDDLAGHVRRYTRQELVGKVTAAGFEVNEVDCWGFPLSGWLAIRGARMRGRRVAEHADGEVPGALARVMPIASVVFSWLARAEAPFTKLDRGSGYVIVARRR